MKLMQDLVEHIPKISSRNSSLYREHQDAESKVQNSSIALQVCYWMIVAVLTWSQ